MQEVLVPINERIIKVAEFSQNSLQIFGRIYTFNEGETLGSVLELNPAEKESLYVAESEHATKDKRIPLPGALKGS